MSKKINKNVSTKENEPFTRCIGEPNIQKFYETLARILSEREQVKITVKVTKKDPAA